MTNKWGSFKKLLDDVNLVISLFGKGNSQIRKNFYFDIFKN